MTIDGLLSRVLPDRGNITSNSSVSYLPTQLFESLIPGYSTIHRFLLFTFGIDITILVSAFFTIWALIKLGKSLRHSIDDLLSRHFMCSINIVSHDSIHSHVLKWLGEQPSMKTSRALMAETLTLSAWDLDDETLGDTAVGAFLNFSNQEAKLAPRFTPAFGSHNFWHKGTYFMLRRTQSSVLEEGGFLNFADKEDLVISCYGRSSAPLKDLLQHAKSFYMQDHDAKTVIRRPASKLLRQRGSGWLWVRVATRPCRPMDTVVLEANRKAEILADINEYLHPATPRWYANRGIPYRRGYLFHGPPGTGKTSLSFALAGVFGLDIYVISLLESSLTEEDLSQLFSGLPRRCVVLLEDIDSAGLKRPEDPKVIEEQSSPSTGSDAAAMDGWKVVSTDLANALKKARRDGKDDDNKNNGISLSGLLNAIDGVASHEGRVLVMTTNKPEELDSALIRPGRVDLQVAFGNASQAQIKELFERMYTFDPPKPRTKQINNSTDAAALPTQLDEKAPTILPKFTPKPAGETIVPEGHGFPERTLEDCAVEFAKVIPDGVLSPAEIQGFLLKRKKDPQKACAEVVNWASGVIGAREQGLKVLDVQ